MKIETLSIKKYMEITAIAEAFKSKGEAEVNKEIIKYFHGTLDVPKSESDETLITLNTILLDNIDFTLTFNFQGVKYGFIPNLDKIKTSEWCDLDSYIKDGTQYHRICSILYRPIIKESGRTYLIEPYEGTNKLVYDKDSDKEVPMCELMSKIDFRIIKSALVFFYHLRLSLSEAILISTRKEVKKTLRWKTIKERLVRLPWRVNSQPSLDGTQ